MSSSDGDYSDLDQEISKKPGLTSNSRVLPSWASSSSVPTNTGSRGSTQRFRPSKTFRNSNKWYTAKTGKPAKVLLNQGTKSENEVPQKDVKRQLPAYLQSSSFAPSIPVTDVTSSQTHGNNVKPYSLRGSSNDVSMKNDNKTRLLPPSMNASVSVSSTKFVGQSDRSRPEVVQEEVGDERLIYQVAVQNLNQPIVEANLPDGLLSVSLFRHQRIALAWMLEKENSVACSGGILADDQGLGKTISIIALLKMQNFLTKPKLEHTFVSESEFLDLENDNEKGTGTSIINSSGSKVESHSQKPKAGSLVICPASVLRQWAHELDEKVADDAKLKVLIYHGLARTKDPAVLAKYDVVLTTYSIVAKEVPSKCFDDDDSEEDQEKKKRKKSRVSKKGKKGKKGISEDDFIDDDDYDDDQEYKKRKQSRVSNIGKKGRKGISSSDYSDDDDYDYDDDNDFYDDDDSDDSDVDRENKKKKQSRISKKGKKGKNRISATGALAKVKWFRVILDEAQTIKNHSTQVSKSCCELKADKRWCLSGTPIQNSINELFSYFRFLKCEPYANYTSFCNQIKIPISKNSKQGYMKLQAVLKAIMLRRTKDTLIDGKPVISLPPKTVNLTAVDFSTEERAFYLKLEAESRSRFKEYAAAGTVRQNYANILLMLLRLRQACDHPLLVKGFSSDPVSRVSKRTTKDLPQDTQANLLNLLDTLNICLLCSDPPEDAVITLCGHVFCYQCVSEYLTGDENICPSFNCKSQISGDAIFTKSDLRNSISTDDHDDHDHHNSPKADETSLVFQNDYCSSKIKATLDIIQSHCQPNNSIKAIVFSQWTRMLDLVETSLNQHCIDYRRLDGSMSLASRDRAVKEFNTDLKVSVMLMSLKAGNVGLNMVAASHVILLDLWWNPTTEDQAVDRAHRIGQTRPVTVSRLTIKDTVEDRILALQEEKRKIIASAFGEDKSGSSATSITAQDLKYLFMGAH